MGELPTYVLERTFAAPRELVWKTWTDPELLPRWYGPGVETTFEQDGAQTKLRLTWVPHEVSEAEIAGFTQALPGLDKGWGAGMDVLEKMLAELQA